MNRASQRLTTRLVWPYSKSEIIPNIIPSGLKTEHKIRPLSNNEDIKLLGIGALSAGKNWRLAIEALAFLPATYSLRIAGDGPERAPLQALIKEKDLEDRVELLGYVPEASRLLSEVDALIHPSLAETFGYIFFEAAEQRVPVAATRLPVMSEVIPKQIAGVAGGTAPVEFARTIMKALRLDDQDFEVAQQARLEYFNNEDVVSRWASLLKE